MYEQKKCVTADKIYILDKSVINTRTIRAAQGIHKGCPAPFDLSSNRGVQGFEGDCAEVRAVRRTEGKNSPADCF